MMFLEHLRYIRSLQIRVLKLCLAFSSSQRFWATTNAGDFSNLRPLSILSKCSGFADFVLLRFRETCLSPRTPTPHKYKCDTLILHRRVYFKQGCEHVCLLYKQTETTLTPRLQKR